MTGVLWESGATVWCMEVPDRHEVLTAGGSAIGVKGLFEAHADGVYTLGFRMLGDYHAAEDLVQETFVTVLRRLGTFRGEGSMAGWLYRIAYRNAIALIRKRRDLPSDPAELPEVVDAGASVEDRVLVGELSAALDRAVARLDPDQRAAFVLHSGRHSSRRRPPGFRGAGGETRPIPRILPLLSYGLA